MIKKLVTIAVLAVMLFVILYFSYTKPDTHKVLKIINAAEFYVDFNDNEVADEEEFVKLIQFELEPSSLNTVDTIKLNYTGKQFAKEQLLNKPVKIVRSNVISVILPDGKEYNKLLEQNGYVLTKENKDKVQKNIEYASTLNLVTYNTKTNKYHRLDCKFALSSPNIEVIPASQLPKQAKPCKNCHLNVAKKDAGTGDKTSGQKKYPRYNYEKYSPVYKDNFIEFYTTDFIKYYYPSNKCFTTVCKSLLNEINNAKTTIDFAIYGIDGQPEINKALINAQKRGVKIRWVYDTNKNGSTIYKESLALAKHLQNNRRDIDYDAQILKRGNVKDANIKDSIMHNKFFIFDNQKVWTGSANISHTDLSGFNANSAVLINSSKIAQIYKAEFEQMYAGKFHIYKNKTADNVNILGNSKISVYFSPQDKIITNRIIHMLDAAKTYIYIPVFVVTHKDFNNALIRAKNRGVDIRLIVDATSAGQKYSSVKFLRENKIPVKAENRAGKMHMKSIIIDDKYTIIGSMNFTKSGEKYNDENVLIIENPKIATAFKKEFLRFWREIPDKWLYKNPGAESFNSINSCYDGVDNDFDEKVDTADDSCGFQLKKTAIAK